MRGFNQKDTGYSEEKGWLGRKQTWKGLEVMKMDEKKVRPQDKWNEKNGLVSKSYKLQKEIADAFAETCDRVGVSKKAQLEKMMLEFIEENRA